MEAGIAPRLLTVPADFRVGCGRTGSASYRSTSSRGTPAHSGRSPCQGRRGGTPARAGAQGSRPHLRAPAPGACPAVTCRALVLRRGVGGEAAFKGAGPHGLCGAGQLAGSAARPVSVPGGLPEEILSAALGESRTVDSGRIACSRSWLPACPFQRPAGLHDRGLAREGHRPVRGACDGSARFPGRRPNPPSVELPALLHRPALKIVRMNVRGRDGKCGRNRQQQKQRHDRYPDVTHCCFPVSI